MVYVMTDELYHHGIKGQKWGVRNYQNADGSLTGAGRLRYYGDSAAGKLRDYGNTAKQKVSSMREAKYAKRDRRGIVGRPKDRSQQSKNHVLDMIGGRKINADYETRVQRGKELKSRGRTEVGAIGRFIGRKILFGIGAGLAVGALSNGSALANFADADKLADALDAGSNAAQSVLKVAGTAFLATSAIRTYQDISDIHTYKEDKRSQKRKK